MCSSVFFGTYVVKIASRPTLRDVVIVGTSVLESSISKAHSVVIS